MWDRTRRLHMGVKEGVRGLRIDSGRPDRRFGVHLKRETVLSVNRGIGERGRGGWGEKKKLVVLGLNSTHKRTDLISEAGVPGNVAESARSVRPPTCLSPYCTRRRHIPKCPHPGQEVQKMEGGRRPYVYTTTYVLVGDPWYPVFVT